MPPQDPSLTVSDVKPSFKERALGVIGGILSGGAGQKPGESALDQAIAKHHQQRLDEARMHRQNAATYAGVLATGFDPKTGQKLTPEQEQQYQNWYDTSWAAYEKAAGLTKETKGALQRAKAIADRVIHLGRQNRQGGAQGAGGGASGVGASVPGGGAVGGGPDEATLTEGERSPQRATGLPPPPTMPQQTSAQANQAAMAAPTIREQMADLQDPKTVSGKLRADRLETDQRVELAQKVGMDPRSRDYQEFVTTGKFPTAARLQKMTYIDPRDPTGTPKEGSYDPTSGQIFDQDQQIVPDAKPASAAMLRPKMFTYQGPNGEPLIGMQQGTKFLDQEGNLLPPGTLMYVRGAVPTETLAQRLNYDPQGNPIINTFETIRGPAYALGKMPRPGGAGGGAGAGAGAAAPKGGRGLPPPPTAGGGMTPQVGRDALGRPLGFSAAQQKNQAQRATTLKEGIRQIFGDPGSPQLQSLNRFSDLADDPKSRERLGRAWNLLVDNTGLAEEEKTHGATLTLLQAYFNIPQRISAAYARIRQDVQKELSPRELEALDAEVTSYSSVVGARALTSASSAMFSVKALERDVPIIGNTATSSAQFRDKLTRLGELYNIGLDSVSDQMIPREEKEFYRNQMGIAPGKTAPAKTEAPARKGGLPKPPTAKKKYKSADEEIEDLANQMAGKPH